MGYVVRPGEFREAQDQSSAVGADRSTSRQVLAGFVVSPQQQFMGSPGTRHGHEHAALVRHQAPAANLKKQTAPFNSKSPRAESVKMNLENQATNRV